MRNRSARITLTLLFIILLSLVFNFMIRKWEYVVFHRNIECPEVIIQKVSHKLNDRLRDYKNAAKKKGIIPIENEASIILEDNLVKVHANQYYIIDNLTHSYPFLTQESLDLLNAIGQSFQQKLVASSLADTKFIVTSLTRTKESVSRLTRLNGNAVKDSPHLYGVSFDISYNRFHLPYIQLSSCHKKYLQEVLAQAIQEQRENNNCWATKETKQLCYHVVAQ